MGMPNAFVSGERSTMQPPLLERTTTGLSLSRVNAFNGQGHKKISGFGFIFGK